MNDGLKQRLVGAIVLLCLALILWPVIFSDTERSVVDRNSQIPPMPDFEKFTVSEPVIPEQQQPQLQQPEPVPEIANVENTQPTEKPQLNDANLPVSWVLKVGSFKEPGNAETLKLALQKLGHKAYTRSVTTANGRATRVFVGPRFRKSDFDKDKASIDKMFTVTSQVVRFEQ